MTVKPDEIALLTAALAGEALPVAADRLRVPAGRVGYVARKWESRGWYAAGGGRRGPGGRRGVAGPAAESEAEPGADPQLGPPVVGTLPPSAAE